MILAHGVECYAHFVHKPCQQQWQGRKKKEKKKKKKKSYDADSSTHWQTPWYRRAVVIAGLLGRYQMSSPGPAQLLPPHTQSLTSVQFWPWRYSLLSFKKVFTLIDSGGCTWPLFVSPPLNETFNRPYPVWIPLPFPLFSTRWSHFTDPLYEKKFSLWNFFLIHLTCEQF